MQTCLKSIVWFCILNLLFYFAYSQNKKDIEKFKKIIYTLADDSMLGRAAGSVGEEKAKRYLMGYYYRIGLMPFSNSYVEKFMFPKDSAHTDTAMNIIGMIDNKTDSTIVIGAHYDHIGMGGPKSRSLVNNKIHNGADDNASGIAMMLTMAESLKNSENKKYNYLFVAFSAHEDGLYGSQAFVAEKKYDLPKVKLMLNFDMVGRLDVANPVLKVVSNEKDVYLDTLLNSANHEFQLKIDESNMSRTDASVFIENNIPAITFTTGTHDDYHKVSDDANKINYEGMYEIEEYLINFLKTVK